jgi:Purple acid Phosphatase, N-terminal domain
MRGTQRKQEEILRALSGNRPTNRLLLTVALTVMVGGALYITPAVAQLSLNTKKAASVEITQGPEIERADSYLTIVRWTTNNPGGSPEHYGVVHYGTDPKDLSQTAKSPIRLNPEHAEIVFRVRIDGLQPKTTYYYTVDSMEANGTGDGVKSTVKHFTTQ